MTTQGLDCIEIHRLELPCHIGVPDEERAHLQTLWVTVKMYPQRSFQYMADDIGQTIDYALVAEQLVSLARQQPRALIETMAADIARFLRQHHPLQHVQITIEKRILPNADYVAVHHAL
jgi:FolB domain-containing protein